MSYRTKEADNDAVLRSILTARAKDGATIAEIRTDFRELLGEVPLIFDEPFSSIKNYLCSLNGVFYAIDKNTYLWFYQSHKTRHITQMVQQQKPSRQGGRTAMLSHNRYRHQQQTVATRHQQQTVATRHQHQPHVRPAVQTILHGPVQPPPLLQSKSIFGSTNSCYFKDNDHFRMNRQYLSEPSLSARSRSNTSLNSASSSGGSGGGGTGCDGISGGGGGGTGDGGNGNTALTGSNWRQSVRGSGTGSSASSLNIVDHRPAYLYEYQLIGDDFLLALALTDLNASLARDGRRTKRSGLCISGQTIRDATRHVSQLMTPINENVIVNIGSVDLLHGHEFADMKSDFLHLMEAFAARHIVPVITTLAPLANKCHIEETRRKWNFFNAFLLKAFPNQVLDITLCFRNSGGLTLHDCYQPMAKYVSGSCQPHALWNRLGRQRVLGFLKKQVYENFDVVDR